MIVYFFFFISMIFLTFVEITSSSKRFTKLILIILSLSLIFLAGLRWEVGTDWDLYEWFFSIVDISEIGYSGHEFFYDLLLRSVKYLFSSYTSMLFVTAFIIVFFTFKTLWRYSIFPIFSILLLFTYSINSSGFGYRQDIAIAISFFSFHFIYKRKLIKFLICIFSATMFHQTAIIFVVAYWIYNIRWTRKYLFIIIGVTIAGYLLISQLGFIAELYTKSSQGKLDYYMQNSDETFGAGDANTVLIRGISNRFFLLLLPLLVIFTNKKEQVEELKKIYNIFLFGFLFFLIFGSVAVVFLRFTRYFDIFHILVIPLTYYLAPKKQKMFLFLLILIYLIVKFSSVIINDDNIFVPYKTIFD